jgi:hypothetical protein
MGESRVGRELVQITVLFKNPAKNEPGGGDCLAIR